METIYEGYLVHYGRPRLFAPGDHDTMLLLGDYLYAQGLVRLAAEGSVEAVADMGELISLCAQLRAEGSSEDGPVWAASVALLGQGVLKETDDRETLDRPREGGRRGRARRSRPRGSSPARSLKSQRMGHVLAAALVLADAATEGKKVIFGMLVTGLILVALPVLGETYMYFRYHRHGRSPH